jgi:hypothetical protein
MPRLEKEAIGACTVALKMSCFIGFFRSSRYADRYLPSMPYDSRNVHIASRVAYVNAILLHIMPLYLVAQKVKLERNHPRTQEVPER